MAKRFWVHLPRWDKSLVTTALESGAEALMLPRGKSAQAKSLGIITTRTALDTIGRTIEVKGETVAIKEFPATTIEEAIIQGVKAEKAGVKGIICGPIAATTLERVVDIPITAFRFDEELLMDAISKLADKL